MGRPKAWLPFGPEVFLQRTVRILRGVVDPVVVVASPGQTLPALPGSVIVAHDDRPYFGPLNGLAAGLAALTGRAQIAYLSSCDAPFLSPDFVRRIVTGVGELDVCLPEVDGFKHPLAAAYRVNVLPVVRELLASGHLRPVFLAERLPTRVLTAAEVAEVDPTLGSLQNVNTPGEYEAALKDAGYLPPDSACGSTGRP
jgi:molybdopterin-guanine dinucleotide biosynthesis protein A